MNSFFEHHKDSIRWHYRCFDRILLNGLIQPFQQPERVVGFSVSTGVIPCEPANTAALLSNFNIGLKPGRASGTSRFWPRRKAAAVAPYARFRRKNVTPVSGF